jgi:hypothetical protein
MAGLSSPAIPVAATRTRVKPVSNLLAYSFAVPAFAAVVIMAVREHRNLRATRRDLLDGCRGMLEDGEIKLENDDFPRLKGQWRGRPIDVELIPDTMTMRRLPQLWLSTTWLAPLPVAGAFAALVRHSGYEFYGLTSRFEHRLEPPAGLPAEIIIRGKDARSQELLDRMREPLAAIFSDPLVKEVDVTPNGLRIIRQASEGRRGEHLLLRQAVFDAAHVPTSDLARVLFQLEELQAAARTTTPDQRGARAA